MTLEVSVNTFRADRLIFGQYVHRADGLTDAVRIHWFLPPGIVHPQHRMNWWVWL